MSPASAPPPLSCQVASEMQSKLHSRFSRWFSNSHLIAENSLILKENPAGAFLRAHKVGFTDFRKYVLFGKYRVH